MKIAILQHESCPGEPARQLAALREAAGAASDAGAALLLCPELFMSGYNLGARVANLAEPAGGPFMQQVCELARERALMIVYGYPEAADGGVYNSAAVVGVDGAVLANHRKLHLAPYPYERNCFVAGDRLTLFEAFGVRAAVLICYDLEFPEAVRACARRGADLLLVPTGLRQQYAHLTGTLVPTRAFENRIYVAYANYAGVEYDWTYCGGSCLAGPDGHLVAQSGERAELLLADFDPASLAAARASIDYLADLREDLYRRAGP